MPKIDPRQVQAALEQGLISEEDAQMLLQGGAAGMEDSEALEGHGPGQESSMTQEEGGEEEEQAGGTQQLDQETLTELLGMLADPNVSPAQKSRIAQIIVEAFTGAQEEETEKEYEDEGYEEDEEEPDDRLAGLSGVDLGSLLQQATAQPTASKQNKLRQQYASPLE